MIARSGYNRFTSQAVLYGPTAMGGVGFLHMYNVQSYGQLKLFKKFWRTPQSIPGKLLRVTMAWLQKSAGTSTPILEDTHTRLPHLEAKWISSIRTYLGTINSHLNLTGILMPKLQRQQDAYIMDIVLSMRLRPAEVRRINFCRLFLNATLLSDITTANGTTIEPHATHGHEITSPVIEEAC